jgi:hypothetical protein
MTAALRLGELFALMGWAISDNPYRDEDLRRWFCQGWVAVKGVGKA